MTRAGLGEFDSLGSSEGGGVTWGGRGWRVGREVVEDELGRPGE